MQATTTQDPITFLQPDSGELLGNLSWYDAVIIWELASADSMGKKKVNILQAYFVLNTILIWFFAFIVYLLHNPHSNHLR